MKTHWNNPAAPMGKQGKIKKGNGKNISQSKYDWKSNNGKSLKAGPKSGC